MRKARFLAFLKRTNVAAALASGLAFAGPGCHQHYHYYNTDPCAPAAPMPSTMRSSVNCDPQTSVVDGGTTVAESTTRSTTVSGGETKSPRVVVSNPSNNSPLSAWKRSDVDSLATTSVQGSVDDSKVNR
jgi:hypothetical protein